MFFEFNNFAADKNNAEYVERETDPENLDLILGDEGGNSGNSKNRHQVHQIVGATGDHGRRRSGSGHTNYLAHPTPLMH